MKKTKLFLTVLVIFIWTIVLYNFYNQPVPEVRYIKQGNDYELVCSGKMDRYKISAVMMKIEEEFYYSYLDNDHSVQKGINLKVTQLAKEIEKELIPIRVNNATMDWELKTFSKEEIIRGLTTFIVQNHVNAGQINDNSELIEKITLKMMLKIRFE